MMTDRARRGAVRGASTQSGSAAPGAIAPPPLMRRSRTFLAATDHPVID